MRPFASVLSARAEKSSTVAPEAEVERSDRSKGRVAERRCEKIQDEGWQGSYNIHKVRFNSYRVSAHASWI
jgi:hypothetical protein